ncbi:MAG TPA: hydrogenase nickel incorporation protein HypB, partial [Tepidisphaeraceae bacterium]|nr:hydrogenase nickel incorporation protein HypB [Tepidisphaeraceae bacterium]
FRARKLKSFPSRLTMQPRILQVRQRILKKNDEQARALRQRFEEARVLVVSLVSSPGAGKTALLRQTLIKLANTHRIAALVGDLATENDAKRLAESGVPVKQIITGTVCHLEAEMVESALADWDLSQLDILFIENVGNLVCPASYDLGEALRVVLFSTTEGEDKPLKYPTIFNTADVAIITKIDLAGVVGFDRRTAHESIQNVRPGMNILELSARSGEGMEAWIQLIQSRITKAEPMHAH